MNKQEKFAWARWTLTALIIVYLASNLFIDQPGIDKNQPNIHDFMSKIFYGFFMIFLYLGNYTKGIAIDERDMLISGSAAKHGLVAISLVIFVSVTFIRGPYEQWVSTRSPFWLEHYLIVCIAFGWWVEASISVFHYWRDRRA